jgi:tetratricopeptide (TPR) repeat protein
VTSHPEAELLSQLSVLKDSELIYESGIYPQSRFIFKHALTLEVVYNSILTKTKKRLHREIGNAIEDLNRDNIEGCYGILAEHFIESEDYAKGAEYSKLARKKALKSASFRGAVEHSKKEIMCLEKLSMTETTLRKLVDSRTALANYFMSLNQHAEAKEAVAPIADLAAELQYNKKLPVIYTAIGSYHLYVEEDHSNGMRYLDKVFATAEKAGDFVSLWFASYNLALAFSWNCEFEKGQEYFKKCLDLSKLANNVIGICFTKGTLSAQNYTFHGKIDLAYEISKESLVMANESGDIYIKGMAYSSHGSACYFKGLFDESEDFLLNAATLCEKTTHVGWGPWAYSWLASLYSEKGEYEKAEEYWRKAIVVQQEHGGIWPSWVNFMNVLIFKLKTLTTSQDADLGKLSNYYQTNKLRVIEGWIAKLIAETLLNTDVKTLTDAEGWIEKAIESDKTNGMMWCLANDYALYAELSKRQGNKSKAEENLSKAIDILKECSADGWVKKYERELSSLT